MKSAHEAIISDPRKLAAEIANDVMAGEGEIADAINRAIRYERAQCQEIAARFGGRDGEEIAEMIGRRNFAR